MTRLVVLPAAPVLLPDRAQETPAALQPVLAACDAVLTAALGADADVAVVAAPDHLRDLTGEQTDATDPFGRQVVTSLLDRAGHRGVRRPVAPDQVRGCGAPVVLFAADGSASVGEKSPRPGEAGAEVDARLRECLAAGDLAPLTDLDDTAAAAVGCVTAPVWRALGAFGAVRAVVLHEFAPFGVTYFVAELQTAGHPSG